MKYAIDSTFAAAAAAIVLGAIAGVLVAVFPADVNPWVAPLVFAITAFAGLIRRQFNVPDGE